MHEQIDDTFNVDLILCTWPHFSCNKTSILWPLTLLRLRTTLDQLSPALSKLSKNIINFHKRLISAIIKPNMLFKTKLKSLFVRMTSTNDVIPVILRYSRTNSITVIQRRPSGNLVGNQAGLEGNGRLKLPWAMVVCWTLNYVILKHLLDDPA